MVPEVIKLLRAATHQIHMDLHDHPLLAPLIQSGVGEPHHTRALKALYGFYRPLLDDMRTHNCFHSIEHLTTPSDRWLARDLMHYGIDPNQLPHCYRLPTVNRCEDLLGVAYVKEGSLLGGRQIAKNLQQNLGQNASTYYFTGIGGDTLQHWQRVVQNLQRQAPRCNVQRMQEAANDTFHCLKHWLDQCARIAR